MDDVVTIAHRFRGPERSGNGGYSAGLLAAAHPADGRVEVRLRKPPPLETPLRRSPTTLLDGDVAIAEAIVDQSTLDLVVPPPVPLDIARACATPLHDHALPGCFVCGPDREPGDGLRIFAAPVDGRVDGVVAASWTPDTSLPHSPDGAVAPEVVWAALDCPGAFTAVDYMSGGPEIVVLGSIRAHQLRPVGTGDELVAMGWPLGQSGRRIRTGTALVTDAGEVVAKAQTIWVVVPAEQFVV